MTFVDPFVRLQGIPAVLDMILKNLDHKSLCKVQEVCKLWYESVMRGFSWRKQLQDKVSSEIIWKEIYDQLPESNYKEAVCPDKKKFSIIFQAAKKLDLNWMNGCSKMRVITLHDQDNFNQQVRPSVDAFAMNSKFLVISSPSGLIKVFNRKDLARQTDLDHGGKVKSVKFMGNYLLTASVSHVKVWDMENKQLLETILLPCPVTKYQYDFVQIGSVDGLLVCRKELEFVSYDDLFQNVSYMFLAWRLISPKKNNGKARLELVHKEQLPASPFSPDQSFLSEKHIVTVLLKISPIDDNIHEVMVEVRSTVDFSVVYSVKEPAFLFFRFAFFNDMFGVQMVLKNQRNLIKIVDCNQRSSRDIEMGPLNMFFITSNSKFALLCSALMPFQLNKQPLLLSNFGKQETYYRAEYLSRIEGLEMKVFREKIGTVIMDELSIFEFRLKLDRKTGKESYQLILADFLELPGDSPISCCFKCEKFTQDPRRCSRCHRMRYCSAECQRADWIRHKSNCSSL